MPPTPPPIHESAGAGDAPDDERDVGQGVVEIGGIDGACDVCGGRRCRAELSVLG